MRIPRFEYDLISSLRNHFPLQDQASVQQVVEAVGKELSKGPLDLNYIEVELLTAARKMKLQLLIKQLIAQLPPCSTPRLPYPSSQESHNKPVTFVKTQKNIKKEKTPRRRVRAGSKFAGIQVETPTEQWIREAEEVCERNKRKLEGTTIYDSNATLNYHDIWRDEGLTPPPLQE